MWRPRAARRTSATPHGVARRKAGRSSPSRRALSARTAPPSPKESTSAEVRAAIAATRGSAALRTAVPSAGRAATSSPLASATASIEPKVSVCTAATRVTTPTAGRATAQREAMWPGPRAPISITAASVPSSAPTSVRGTPSSLLNDPALATVRHRAASAAASRSFTLVLPTEPVTPTTRPATVGASRSRAWAPSAASASSVSGTSTAVTTTPAGVVGRHVGRGPRRQDRRRPGRQGRADEVVSVAVGHDGDEQLAAPHQARVDRRSRHGDVRADEPSAGGGGDLAGAHVHDGRSSQVATDRPARPAGRRHGAAASAGPHPPPRYARTPWPAPIASGSWSCSAGSRPSTRSRASAPPTCSQPATPTGTRSCRSASPARASGSGPTRPGPRWPGGEPPSPTGWRPPVPRSSR